MTVRDHGQADAWPFFLTVLWIAAMPVSMLLGNRHLAGIPALTAERLGFLLAVGSFVASLAWYGRRLAPIGWVEKSMLLFLTVILVSWGSTLRTKSVVEFKQDADVVLAGFVMPFTAFLVARNTVWTPQRLSTCLWVLAGGVGAYLLLFGAVQYIYDWSFLVPEALREIHPDRAKGPFESAVPFGLVVALLVPLALFLYLRARGWLSRAALVALAIGLVQSVVACKTRAVWVALLVALVLPAVRYPRIRPLAALLALQVVVQLLLAPAVGIDHWGLHQRLTQPEPFSDRNAVWATAARMIEHRPLFGFGFGQLTFNAEKPNYYAAWAGVSPRWAEFPNSPHNDVLNVLVMLGVIGLVPYLALLWTSWRVLSRGRERWQSARQRGPELATFVQAMFLVVLAVGQLHSTMHMFYAKVLLFFLLGIVAHGWEDDGRGVEAYSGAAARPDRPAQPAAIAASGA